MYNTTLYIKHTYRIDFLHKPLYSLLRNYLLLKLPMYLLSYLFYLQEHTFNFIHYFFYASHIVPLYTYTLYYIEKRE